MDHKHCESCVSLGCTRHNGCPVLQCKNLCGFSMHECKTKEHASELCPRSLVPCVNAVYGCELTMERRKLADHVQHCPASVLVCNFPAAPLNQCSRTDGDGELIADLSPSERLASVTRSPCQLLCRRDERSGHIQTYHLDIIHAPLLFKRCPLAQYGCEHKQPTLVPGPEGTSIDVKSQCLFVQGRESDGHVELTGTQAERRRKQKELAMYGYTVPEVADSFGQLPTEMLVKICGFLDSLGLRSLSQTSYYLKEVCNKLVTKKGITVSAWQRQGSLWVQGPKVSSTPFSTKHLQSGGGNIRLDNTMLYNCYARHFSCLCRQNSFAIWDRNPV